LQGIERLAAVGEANNIVGIHVVREAQRVQRRATAAVESTKTPPISIRRPWQETCVRY
jgi:hypothetical protein